MKRIADKAMNAIKPVYRVLSRNRIKPWLQAAEANVQERIALWIMH